MLLHEWFPSNASGSEKHKIPLKNGGQHSCILVNFSIVTVNDRQGTSRPKKLNTHVPSPPHQRPPPHKRPLGNRVKKKNLARKKIVSFIHDKMRQSTPPPNKIISPSAHWGTDFSRNETGGMCGIRKCPARETCDIPLVEVRNNRYPSGTDTLETFATKKTDFETLSGSCAES